VDCERFGESFIERIPWSVQLSDIMNVGIRSFLDVLSIRAAIMRRGFYADKAA
jgi:hypothetical protein